MAKLLTITSRHLDYGYGIGKRIDTKQEIQQVKYSRINKSHNRLFYENYDKEKCSYLAFLSRVNDGMDIEDAIQVYTPRQKERMQTINNFKSTRSPERFLFWSEYVGEKAPYKLFSNRVSKGFSYEEAINPEYMSRNPAIRQFTKKENIKDTRRNHKGKKSCYKVYRQRRKKGIPHDEAIIEKWQNNTENSSFWKNYKGEKCSYNSFRNKVLRGQSMQEAIRPK